MSKASHRNFLAFFSINFSIIQPLRYIANLFECVAMFHFVKRLLALRITAKPYADRFLLFGSFPVFLHNALDVGSFGRGKERLVPLLAETDNRIDSPSEHLACFVKNTGKQIKNIPARFQRILQQADGLVFLRRCPAYGKVDALPLAVLLFLKLPYRLVPFNDK